MNDSSIVVLHAIPLPDAMCEMAGHRHRNPPMALQTLMSQHLSQMPDNHFHQNIYFEELYDGRHD